MIDRAKEAAARFFERKRGYQIIDRDFETPFGVIDFVLKDTDENALVFCEFSVSNGKFANADATRIQIEEMSIFYLDQHSEIQYRAVRFDLIDRVVINDGISLLRHNINAFGEGSK